MLGLQRTSKLHGKKTCWQKICVSSLASFKIPPLVRQHLVHPVAPRWLGVEGAIRVVMGSAGTGNGRRVCWGRSPRNWVKQSAVSDGWPVPLYSPGTVAAWQARCTVQVYRLHQLSADAFRRPAVCLDNSDNARTPQIVSATYRILSIFTLRRKMNIPYEVQVHRSDRTAVPQTVLPLTPRRRA
ncbi:hypothetical protein J6590_012211 [Homalodisca vitripennis]|nr:hypothetical protein J6590_012211 [Homalodisca vitripennis]